MGKNLQTQAFFNNGTSRWFLSLVCLIGTVALSAQAITGKVSDANGKALPYSSVYIKGSTKGTTANDQGNFFLDLPPGDYTIVCAHVGYQKAEKKIALADKQPQEILFTLREQMTELKNVVVKQGAEDPAYAIIRKAIKTRKQHLNELKQWQVMVYIKGLIRTYELPRKIFGLKVGDATSEIIDSTGKGILYFSESLTRYSRRLPKDYKEEVVSAKVSGSSQGFGFNSPTTMEMNLYENNISLEGLSSRGFVSPINENALTFYRYKFEGTFYEDGQEINKIKIIPKRKYEPCFAGGYINILEGSWRIHSVDLYLTKESQMEFVDSVHITQQMFPIEKNIWMPQQTRFDASFGFLGIKAGASFGAVYSEYDINKNIDQLFKGNIVKIIDTAANKKSVAYWDSIRPAPLTDEERLDYLKKDTLEKRRNDPRYLDSLGRKRNKVSLGKIFLSGINITKRKTHMTYTFPQLINCVQYNTVEGWALDWSPTIRHWGDTGRYLFKPQIRYSIGNKHFNATALLAKTIGKDYRKRWAITISGGRYIYQLNPENPIEPYINSIATLLFTRNLMKIYEKGFGTIAARHSFGNGLRLSLSASYEDRMPMENIDTTYRWVKNKNRHFESNYPEELPKGYFNRHQAFLTSIRFTWQPGQKFVQYPTRRISLGSDQPVFAASYTKAWKNIFNSDADFDKWTLDVNDDFNMRLGGVVRYHAGMGGFINNKNVQLPDWQHFIGNLTIKATPYVKSFQLAPYYANSTKDHFFATGNLEWHLNGLITNKIPLVRRWNLGIVTGGNAFYVDKSRNYFEFFAGIENILKAIRVDYVWGYDGISKTMTHGIVIGFSGLLTGEGIE